MMTMQINSDTLRAHRDPRIGVIGAGHWGINIIRTLEELGVLAGVADVSPEVRAKLSAEYPTLSVFRTHTELMQSDITAVAIATPAQTHFVLAAEALQSKIDLLIEKPITLTVKEAEILVGLAEENDLVLMVGHLLLYQPAIGWIRQFITDGGLGQLQSIHMERLNLGKARPVENVLWSLGVHDVAVALYLVGKNPDRVIATGQRILPVKGKGEDDTYLHLAFSDGIACHLHNSWLWPEKRRRTVLIGTDGMLIYDEIAQTVDHHKKRITEQLENVDEGVELVYEGHGAPLMIEFEHFVSCVNERKKPLSDGRSAVEVLRVLEAADKQMGER